jgi:hypothetical protein
MIERLTKQQAVAVVATRYFGKVCVKHPELEGERHNNRGHGCVGCCRDKATNNRKNNPERERIRRAALHTATKLKIFTYYSKGVPVCECCGEKILMLLTLDHIDGGGAKHKREISKGMLHSSSYLYRWVVQNNFPPLFQVLCFSCNAGKHLNGGICPHQSRASV